MRRAVPALAAGLVVSLAGNVYLATRLRAPAVERAAPSATTTTSPPPPSPTPAPAARSALVHAARTDCSADLADLADRLAASERAVEDHLSLEERHERAGRATQLEAQVEPFLTSVFAGAPDELGHQLECRGGTCRLTVIEREGSAFDWTGRLQDPRLRPSGLPITSMGFHAGTPGQDAVSKEPTLTFDVTFTIATPDAVSGMDLLHGLARDYTASSEVAACKAQHPAPGYLRVRLTLDAGAIAIDAGGTLAVEPAGTCLVDALRARADGTSVPPGTLGAVLFFTVAVP